MFCVPCRGHAQVRLPPRLFEPAGVDAVCECHHGLPLLCPDRRASQRVVKAAAHVWVDWHPHPASLPRGADRCPFLQPASGLCGAGRWGVRRRTVTANGGLDQLGRLGETLASTFGWQPAQATMFVLTGIPPMIAAVRANVPTMKVRYEFELDWARRITLDVDPGASSQKVVEAFERARAEYHHAGRRRTTVKHLRLAAFTGAENVDKPWAERFRLWNERFPEWAYPQQSNFRRDAAAAQRRLLSP